MPKECIRTTLNVLLAVVVVKYVTDNSIRMPAPCDDYYYEDDRCVSW